VSETAVSFESIGKDVPLFKNSLLRNGCFILILVLLFGGCSSDRGKLIRFSAEKLLHKANRLHDKAGIKPELGNEQLWSEVKQAYIAVTDYCWKHIDSLPESRYPVERNELEAAAFTAVNRLSGIYFSEKNYDSAVTYLNQLLTLTQLEGQQLLTTRVNLARIRQAKGDWDEAMAIYHSIIDTFYPPVDNQNKVLVQVLNIPMELVRSYLIISDTLGVLAESQSAKSYYNRLIKEWPNSVLATAARSNLARLHVDLGEWDSAIENLQFLKDSAGQVDLQAALLIGDILASGKKDYLRAVSQYNGIMARVADSTQRALLMTRIGRAYFEGKQYEKCREIMGEIKRYYERFYNTNPTPLNYIARSFAEEGNWEMAESEFRWLISNYSGTEDAFNAHLMIIDHYKKVNEKRQVEAWNRRAEEFYERMSRQHYGTSIEASALSYSAEIARREEKWEKAADLLTQLYKRFSQTETGRSALIKAATIYREKLNQPEVADELMNRLKAELSPLSAGKNTD